VFHARPRRRRHDRLLRRPRNRASRGQPRHVHPQRQGRHEPLADRRLASGVPGSLLVYEQALERYGKKKLPDLLEPAAKLADDGFPINRSYARKVREVAKEIDSFPATKALLKKPDGTPLDAGDVLRQPNLAKSYRAIAREGTNWFYKGEFARTVGDWMKANGGILTADDFARYEVKQREPLVTKYRSSRSSASRRPVPAGCTWRRSSAFRAVRPRGDGEGRSRVAPARDRRGDEARLRGPRALAGRPGLRPVPARSGRSGIRPAALGEDRSETRHTRRRARPAAARRRGYVRQKHTTHIAAADAAGNWVAITTTVNTAFGSKVIVPGTGVILNNQMDDFSIEPGVPNHFKLIGAEANAVAPLKRPLSSMSPTIVLNGDGRPILTVGAAGGPTIITQVLLALSNQLDLRDDIASALRRPRIHHNGARTSCAWRRRWTRG
jgi:gamma-glutamyltranspeptidase/glutathione hydrolase